MRNWHDSRARVPGQRGTGGAAAEPEYRYWAFLSYSRRDEKWAAALHRKLEAYRVPRSIVLPAAVSGSPGRRVRPVFRDTDELAVSSDLDAGLVRALDDSRCLILLASRASAGSRYVDAEVRRLLDTGRGADIRVVVLEDGDDGAAPLPPSLARAAAAGREPLWLDGRGVSAPGRKAVVRLVAGLLGVSFDALWRRTRRRALRRALAAGTAAAVLAGGVLAVVQRQRAEAETARPEHQIAAFRTYLAAQILATSRAGDPRFASPDPDFEILRTDDFNRDSLVDFFVINRTFGFCGSGGCSTEAYLSEAPGRYRTVADLFSSTTPRTRDSDGPFKEIVTTDYSVDAQEVYSVHRWTGDRYELHHLEFCGRTYVEYCDDPMMITLPDAGNPAEVPIVRETDFHDAPAEDAPAVRVARDRLGLTATVIGRVAGADWQLVNVWKGESAFVRTG